MKIKFFCDIIGTFTTSGKNKSDNKYLRKYELDKFTDLLEKCATNELSFSFSSTLSMNEKLLYEIKLLDVLKEKKLDEKIFVETIKQFNENDKVCQMIMQLYDNDYDIVYYCEDSKINVRIFEHLFCKKFSNKKLITFVPDNGLSSLNDLIEESLNQITLKKT